MNKKISGFTLIELIIGITILSLLAVALLAALDPVEQFNKARDTTTRNTAMELHNAVLRYNAARDQYPDPVATITSFVTVDPTFVQTLVQSGELKSNFATSAGGASALGEIRMFNTDPGTGSSTGVLYTCFMPKSKQFKLQKGMFDLATGAYPTPNATCAVQGNDPTARANCAYCAQ
jgi:prepilin-type N-terminal cleavage/methylation domain-containing protein